MFGFTRTRSMKLSVEDTNVVKKFYCAYCDTIKKYYGVPYTILANWEGRFITLLTESQSKRNPVETFANCPITLGFAKQLAVESNYCTRYAAAITLLLFGHKLEDDVADDRTIIPRVAKFFTKNKVAKAYQELNDNGFPIQKALGILERQLQLESSQKVQSLDQVTAPTGEAVSLILAHTAVISNNEQNKECLHALGTCVGRLITLLDACNDFQQDIDQRKFNAITATVPDSKKRVPFSNVLYLSVEDYLFVQLKEIRDKFKLLLLYKHKNLIENILLLGLYDSVKLALRRFSRNFTSLDDLKFREGTCIFCGKSIGTRFCIYCGALNSIAKI